MFYIIYIYYIYIIVIYYIYIYYIYILYIYIISIYYIYIYIYIVYILYILYINVYYIYFFMYIFVIYIYIIYFIYIYIFIIIYIYAFTHVYHQYVDRRGNRHIPLSAGFHDSQERHCQMCKQCDLSLPGDRMDPETTTLCHPLTNSRRHHCRSGPFLTPPCTLFVGHVPVYQALSARSMPYLATSPTKGLDGRVYISGSDEPDIVKRHITDRSDRMKIGWTRGKIVKGWNSWWEIRFTSGLWFKPACCWQWPAGSMVQPSQEFTFYRSLGEGHSGWGTPDQKFVIRGCEPTMSYNVKNFNVGTHLFLCIVCKPCPCPVVQFILRGYPMPYPGEKGKR